MNITHRIPVMPLPIKIKGKEFVEYSVAKKMIEEKTSELDIMDEAVSMLMKNNDDLYKEKNEYQCQIKQLQSDLKEVVDRTQDYDLVIHCGSPITVAQELIKKTSSATDFFGNEHMNYYYSKSELKQIAEHLMVYVNNVEDRD